VPEYGVGGALFPAPVHGAATARRDSGAREGPRLSAGGCCAVSLEEEEEEPREGEVRAARPLRFHEATVAAAPPAGAFPCFSPAGAAAAVEDVPAPPSLRPNEGRAPLSRLAARLRLPRGGWGEFWEPCS